MNVAGNTNGRAEDTKRGSRSARREDPRRHTLLGDHENYSQQLTRSMDLEVTHRISTQCACCLILLIALIERVKALDQEECFREILYDRVRTYDNRCSF